MPIARAISFATRLGLVVACVALCTTAVRATTLDFEDLTVLQMYDLDAGTPAAPDSFVTGGVTVQLGLFFLKPSGTADGQAGVLDSIAHPTGTAGGTGNYVFISNVNLAFDFGGPVSSLVYLFGEFGGNVNFQVNGVLQNVDSHFVLPATVGGADVTIESVGGTPAGVLGKATITGMITSFAIGGQEFSIDNVAYVPVPEPATWLLAIIGFAALLATRPGR
jgi:hypothetical protein